MKIDLCSIRQNDKQFISFLSQTVGLMADLDLGTEHLRWMGDTRFVIGYIWEGLFTTFLIASFFCIIDSRSTVSYPE